MKKIDRILLSYGKLEYNLPVGAEIIDVICQFGEVYLYYTYDPEKWETETRVFIVAAPHELDMYHKFYLNHCHNNYGDVVFVVEDFSCTTA